MKKMLSIISFFITGIIICCATTAIAQTNFSQALKTCEKYSQEGSATHGYETFNILITLEKAKNGKCVYKEKIYQGKNYQLLTCNFDSSNLPFLSDSMEAYTNKYKNEIAKNKIFEAKMTTNAEIFQKVLVEPKYCAITYSKK